MTLTPAQVKALAGKLSFKHVKTRRTAKVVSRSWWNWAALAPGWHDGVDRAARSRSVGERSRLGQPSTRRRVI